MAVSLAHLSQEPSRGRATTTPSGLPPPPPLPPPRHSSGQPLVASTTHGEPRLSDWTVSTSPIPVYPAANQPWIGIPVAPMTYPPHQRHSYQPGSEFSQTPAYAQQRHSYQSNSEHSQPQLPYPPLVSPEATERPPLPPRPTKQQQPPSPHDSIHSSDRSSTSTAPSWPTSIEPDPLPPHSNPQALTQTQSEAFAQSKPIPSLTLSADEVWSAATGLAEFRIQRDGAHLPRKLSSKPLVTVTRTADGQTVGTIKFHTFTPSNDIELSLPSGRSTTIAHSGVLRNRWGWQILSSTNTWDRWYWKRDQAGAVLESGKHKHGDVLARMDGDRLSFVRGRLRPEEYDEVVLSAVAMVEAARRKKGKNDVWDLGGAVADLLGG